MIGFLPPFRQSKKERSADFPVRNFNGAQASLSARRGSCDLKEAHILRDVVPVNLQPLLRPIERRSGKELIDTLVGGGIVLTVGALCPEIRHGSNAGDGEVVGGTRMTRIERIHTDFSFLLSLSFVLSVSLSHSPTAFSYSPIVPCQARSRQVFQLHARSLRHGLFVLYVRSFGLLQFHLCS